MFYAILTSPIYAKTDRQLGVTKNIRNYWIRISVGKILVKVSPNSQNINDDFYCSKSNQRKSLTTLCL